MYFYTLTMNVSQAPSEVENLCDEMSVSGAAGLIVAEDVPSEVKNVCDLINTIFSEAVACQVGKLRKETCLGCQMDHPSQRKHECLMLTVEEGCLMHGLSAVERVIEREILWKQFFEAIRVEVELLRLRAWCTL